MDKRIFTSIIIILIVSVRIAYHIAHPDIYSDNIAQIATAQNFMEGHGLSFKYINAELETYYKTDIQYPPLYPFLLALITFLTGDPLISSLLIQISVLIALVIIWRRIFDLLKHIISEEGYIYFITLLLISTSIFNVINTLIFVSLLLFSISIYFMISYLLKGDTKKVNIYISSIFAALLFWTHYSNFFLAFYPAVFLFITSYLSRNKPHLRVALSSFSISLIITSGLLVYNYLSTGFINYMENPSVWKTGFFIEHLLLIDPFFLNAFIKSSYIAAYLFGNNQPVFLKVIFHLISFTALATVIYLFIRLKNNRDIKFEKFSHLFILLLTIIGLVILFLLLPTLRYHELPLPGWTHIGEPRYLSIVYLSIIALATMLIFIKSDYISRKFIIITKTILVFLIFTNTIIVSYAFISELDKYGYKINTYNQDHQDLRNNIKLELSKGNLPVFIESDLIVDSFRMCQLDKAAVINASEIDNIEKFPSNIVFFFTLPGENEYRDIDHKLLSWSNQFNIEIIGQVRSIVPLYRVNSLKVIK